MSFSKSLLFSFFVSMILLPSLLYGQGDQLTREQLQDMTSSRIITKAATSTIGTRFFTADFIKGHILLGNNSQTATIYLRYDMSENSVQFLRNDEILVTESSQIEGFQIYAAPQDITFKNGFKTSAKGISPNTLLRIAHDAKLKLLVKHEAKLHEDLATYGSATKKNKYNVYDKYYLVTEDGTFNLIKPEAESIFGILSDKSTELKRYAEENNLEFNNEKHLIQILKFYETL